MPRGLSRTLFRQRDQPLVHPLLMFEASYVQDGFGWPARPIDFSPEDDQ
jgi:hypothetical protein